MVVYDTSLAEKLQAQKTQKKVVGFNLFFLLNVGINKSTDILSQNLSFTLF